MKQVIFTLTSARSGTLYLRDLFRRNVRDCTCRHETFFDWGNPTLLGPSIYDAYSGQLDALRKRLQQKSNYVERLSTGTYLESSHAFLKSAWLVALEFFPQMQLVHSIREPLKVAKSEAYREAWRKRLHAPFHYYRGADGGRYFFWSLTQREEIFESFDLSKLSLFQRYLLQWIEIENRAMSFLGQHDLHARCFTLHMPEDLNNPEIIAAMFNFLRLETFHTAVALCRPRNRSLGPSTIVTAEDEAQAGEVLGQLPAKYLEIFHHEPYCSRGWGARFLRLAKEPHHPGTLELIDVSDRCGSRTTLRIRAIFSLLTRSLKKVLLLFTRLLLGVIAIGLLCVAFFIFNLVAICSDAQLLRPRFRQQKLTFLKPISSWRKSTGAAR